NPTGIFSLPRFSVFAGNVGYGRPMVWSTDTARNPRGQPVSYDEPIEAKILPCPDDAQIVGMRMHPTAWDAELCDDFLDGQQFADQRLPPITDSVRVCTAV